ncbi:UDP-hexose transferase [Siccirubricoccus deserti]|uniref:Glycosyltransferase family 2 protein n=1 Tax=Siccirubricoccus deserti TaxID=2013562 RepID=A0A9X0R2Q3_9PROT|nr:glycosyltransferase family 2 protein [Siccirubricoccus deserti]MBC4017738.1 glycosyltransferase family 2 protein [Siccirubricoccus deserti]GGC61069.1 UDP-hexose transferase [Siccirubricoccus deserti]
MPRDLVTPAPAVSIIMPAHDVARFIGVAVDSVRAQDFADWELLVVDDGSRDGTGAVVAARRDPRIRLIRQANAGVSAARSRAMEEARGEAILFLDADDWLAPDALDRLVLALAAAPEAVGAHGGYAVMEEAAAPGDAPLRLRPGPLPAGELLEMLLVQNLFANGGHVLLRHEAVRRAGPFLQHLRYGEDWEYWIRLALQGPYAAAAGRAPVLFVRQRRGGAYHRMARDPAAFAPAMAAIFENEALAERLGPARLAALRRRSEAENAWIIGRELVRHGERAVGLERLRASVAAAPSPKRALLLAAAHALPMLPRRLHGPFMAYPG